MVQSETAAAGKICGNAGDSRRPKTLADVMSCVQCSPNLSESRRQAILSALRTVARCLGQPPASVLASPASLQKEISGANFLQAGISKKRWINVRSLTTEALRQAGFKIMPSRWKKSEFSLAWTALRSAYPDGRVLVGLSRFMNFCSSRNIEPSDVTDAVFAEYHRHLSDQSLVRNPETIYRRTCRLWDHAGKALPTWPAHRTNLPSPSRGYSLEWSTFPASLRKDVEAFLGNGGNQDIFSTDYAPSVKPATTLGRRKALRQMATALAKDGFPIEEIVSLATLVEPKNFETILRFFLERSGGTPNESLYSQACLLRTIAKHWVKVVSLSKLDATCRNIAREVKKNRGMKLRNRTRLQQFDNPANEAAFLRLPTELFRLARQQDTGGKASVNFALYAVAIELLTVHPLRIKNLAGLDLERNIIVPNDPRYRKIFLAIAGDDVKNGVAVERELCLSTSELILTYLRDYRPRISETPSKWLFPNPSGNQRNVVGFGAQISTVIKRHTGLDIHPHLFRALAVRFIEQENPGSIDMARRLLGHRHVETTIRSYSEGKTGAAHKQYEDLIENKRAEIGPGGRKRRGA